MGLTSVESKTVQHSSANNFLVLLKSALLSLCDRICDFINKMGALHVKAKIENGDIEGGTLVGRVGFAYKPDIADKTSGCLNFYDCGGW